MRPGFPHTKHQLSRLFILVTLYALGHRYAGPPRGFFNLKLARGNGNHDRNTTLLINSPPSEPGPSFDLCLC